MKAIISLMNGVTAILLMSGEGTRFGSEVPKQFHMLAGKKVYLRTLETFIQTGLFEEILLICNPTWISTVQKEIDALHLRQKIRLISGGASRQESSYLGVQACTALTKTVVIHDAVRPFVSDEILRNNVLQAQEHGAVDTCIFSTDTLVYSKDHSQIEQIPPRSHFLRGQTPQSFSLPLILKAHEHAIQNGVRDATDDCQIVLQIDAPVHIVLGEEKNMKITSSLDLFLAEQILRTARIPISDALSKSIKQKVFVITGGTGGIGAALAKEIEQEGGEAVLLSRSSTPFSADLSRPEEVQAAFIAIHEKYGALDGLINCVGQFTLGNVDQLSNTEIQTLIDANLTSVIFCCRHAPIRSTGHIVNVASSSYSRGRPQYAIYSAAKAAVVNFTQALAEERPDLQINVAVPTRTNTPMRRRAFPNEDPVTLLEPAEVAKSVVNILKQNQVSGSIFDISR